MAPRKERDNKLFAAPVQFNDAVDFAVAPTVNGDPIGGGGAVESLIVPANTGMDGDSGAGWVLDGADNSYVTLPQSETGIEWILPLNAADGAVVDTLQVLAIARSTGNNVSLVMEVRRIGILPGPSFSYTPVTVATLTTGPFTENTKIVDQITNINMTINSATTFYYLRIVGTTAASCSLDVFSATVGFKT